MLFIRGKSGRHRRAGESRSIDRGRNDTGHVGVDGEQSLGCLHAHVVDDDGTPVAALRHVTRVRKALHQHIPRARDALRPPTSLCRLARKTVARHGRNHHVEGIGGGATMRGRVGERLDELELLDDGARPAVRDEHRQGIFVLRPHVDEVDVEAIDLGDEVRHGIEARLDFAPVIFGGPVAREFLRGRERHALRKVGDGFLLRESCCQDTPAQFGELRLRSIHLERTNRRCLHHLCGLSHRCLLSIESRSILHLRANRMPAAIR